VLVHYSGNIHVLGALVIVCRTTWNQLWFEQTVSKDYDTEDSDPGLSTVAQMAFETLWSNREPWINNLCFSSPVSEQKLRKQCNPEKSTIRRPTSISFIGVTFQVAHNSRPKMRYQFCKWQMSDKK
jgi:hypothetical protein